MHPKLWRLKILISVFGGVSIPSIFMKLLVWNLRCCSSVVASCDLTLNSRNYVESLYPRTGTSVIARFSRRLTALTCVYCVASSFGGTCFTQHIRSAPLEPNIIWYFTTCLLLPWQFVVGIAPRNAENEAEAAVKIHCCPWQSLGKTKVIAAMFATSIWII